MKNKKIDKDRHALGASHFASDFDVNEVRHVYLATMGARLAHIRASLSQRAMAASLGISLRTYQNYERDQRDPDAKTLIALGLQGWNTNWVLAGVGPERISSETIDQLGDESHLLSEEHLTMAMELADEALEGRWIPKPRYSHLTTLIYEALLNGLPEAQVLGFASLAAFGLVRQGVGDDGESDVGGEDQGGAG